jgi:hypothetical protein
VKMSRNASAASEAAPAASEAGSASSDVAPVTSRKEVKMSRKKVNEFRGITAAGILRMQSMRCSHPLFRIVIDTLCESTEGNKQRALLLAALNSNNHLREFPALFTCFKFMIDYELLPMNRLLLIESFIDKLFLEYSSFV